MIQGGAGTSTNMNANEVIANLALEALGHAPGDYARLHPNDHVNRSQSTNDVYPTAIRLAVLEACAPLRAEQQRLADAFAERARAFAPVLKVGRTQLQDAVPMTLGMEFAGFAATIEEDIARLGELAALLARGQPRRHRDRHRRHHPGRLRGARRATPRGDLGRAAGRGAATASRPPRTSAPS